MSVDNMELPPVLVCGSAGSSQVSQHLRAFLPEQLPNCAQYPPDLKQTDSIVLLIGFCVASELVTFLERTIPAVTLSAFRCRMAFV